MAELRQQWAQLGVDPDEAMAATSPEEEDDDQVDEPFELDIEYWPAWQVFVQTWNQWRIVAGLGGIWYEGIDMGAIESAMSMNGIKQKKRPLMLWAVQVMESEAKAIRNTR